MKRAIQFKNLNKTSQTKLLITTINYAMKNLKYTGILAGIMLFASCGEKANQQRQAPAAMPFPVVEIPAKDITGFTAYPVSIEGTINSAVRAKVSGYITDVLVDEGQKVSKGQTLFTLETAALSQDAGA